MHSSNKISKARIQVEVEVDCDTNRLYGNIQDAIKYLQEVAKNYPGIVLDEHWTGYEDMEMRFVYYREENDDEYNLRMKYEEVVRERNRKAQQEAARRKEIMDKIAELKKKL